MAISEQDRKISGESRSPDVTHTYLEALFRGYQGQILDELDKRGVLPPNTSNIFHSPSKNHERSQAHYPVDYYLDRMINGRLQKVDRVLVSYIGPHSKTSEHYHVRPIVEEYYPLAGELYLHGYKDPFDESPDTQLIPKSGLVVWPGQRHQAETADSHALTLIVMRRAGLVSEDKQHIHLPRENNGH